MLKYIFQFLQYFAKEKALKVIRIYKCDSDIVSVMSQIFALKFAM